MRHSIHRLVTPYLEELESSLDSSFPALQPIRCWALVFDFQFGRLRCYGNVEAAQNVTISLPADQIAYLGQIERALSDERAVRAISDDFNLSASDTATVANLLSRIDSAVARQAPFSEVVSGLTPLLLLNCPGVNAAHLPQFKASFFCPDAPPRISEAVGMLPAFLRGQLRFGRWQGGIASSSLEALTCQQFADGAPGTPTPSIHSVREDRRSDILADFMLAELLAGDVRRFYLPVYESSFLTGSIIVCTPGADLPADRRAEWAYTLLGAAMDLGHRISLGRQRLAAHAVRHGYLISKGSDQLPDVKRALRWLAPLERLIPDRASKGTFKMPFERWCLAKPDAPQVVIGVRIGDKAAVDAQSLGEGQGSDAILREQVTQVIQYNELFRSEREQLRYNLSHTVTRRLSSSLLKVTTGAFDTKTLARELSGILSIFQATLAQVRGEKYALDSTAISFGDFRGELRELFADLCLDPSTAVFTKLRKHFFPRTPDRTVSNVEAQASMRGLLDGGVVFQFGSNPVSEMPVARGSRPVLSALCQEAFVNAIERHDWECGEPVNVVLSDGGPDIRIVNTVAKDEIQKARQVADEFNRGEVAPGLGLTLIAQVFKPVVSPQAHFEVDEDSRRVVFVVPLEAATAKTKGSV